MGPSLPHLREIKATGLRSSSFQSLVVESERFSFPHDRQLTNNGEAAGNELTISSTIQGNKSYTIQGNKSYTILGNEFANVCVRQGIAMKGKATRDHPPSTTSHYQQFNAWKREPKIIETCLKESPRKRSGMRLSEN